MIFEDDDLIDKCPQDLRGQILEIDVLVCRTDKLVDPFIDMLFDAIKINIVKKELKAACYQVLLALFCCIS